MDLVGLMDLVGAIGLGVGGGGTSGTGGAGLLIGAPAIVLVGLTSTTGTLGLGRTI